MNKSSLVNIRRRSIMIIAGTLSSSVLLVLFLAYITVGLSWSVIFERMWLLLLITLGLILFGYIYLYFRLTILRDLALAIGRDQPLPEELVKPALPVIYSMPAAMGITGSFLLVVGTLIHSIDLRVTFDFPLHTAILLLISSLMVFCFAGLAIYFLLKREFRPLFVEVSRRVSPEILAGFDRTWQLPGVRKIAFNIPVRVKIFFGIFTLAVVGFWFCLSGYSLSVRFLEAHKAEGSSIVRISSDDVASHNRQWLVLLVIQAVAGIGLAALIAWLIARDILLPLKDLDNPDVGDTRSRGLVYSNLSEDELGELVQGWHKKIKDVQIAADRKLQGLIAMVKRLNASISKIDEAAGNIFGLFEQQSESATTQVAMISEVSASSQELSSTAGAIAQHAGQIKDVSEMAQGEGDTGVELVSNMIQQMEELRYTTGRIKADLDDFQYNTREIHGILEVIEEISDQINLLSLNAELEAAGSGEAGRRFAVVASEIKRLASGTLSASEQIRKLVAYILESSRTVAMQSSTNAQMIETSTVMAEDVSNAFIQIFQFIQDITVLVKDIASSTGQQRGATELITDNLKEMLESGSSLEKECRTIEREINRLRAFTKELKAFLQRQDEMEGLET